MAFEKPEFGELAGSLGTGRPRTLVVARTACLSMIAWLCWAAAPDAGAQTVVQTLSGVAFDVVFDPIRARAYASLRDRHELQIIDLATGATVAILPFAELPEALGMTPDGGRLWVSLPVQAHDDYWFDEDQVGSLAAIDLETAAQDRHFTIPLDPFDLVTTSSGRVVVSSGSGQWTSIASYDESSGLETGRSWLYQATRIALHPDEQIVYGADTLLGPSDIWRFDLETSGGLRQIGNSPYHGDHRMEGDVWVVPDGELLITRGGDVFTAGRRTTEEDMIYVRALTPEGVPIDALAFDSARHAIFTGGDGRVGWYNLESLESVGETSVGGNVLSLGVVGDALYVARNLLGVTQILRLDHPMLAAGANSTPTAAMTVGPKRKLTTRTKIKLDASSSQDAESGLLYRWDFEDDGVFDVDFSTNPRVARRFDTPGSKFVHLQVKDAMGLVDDVVQQLDVAFAPDPARPDEGSPGFELAFEVTDIAYDPIRPYAYVSSRESRKVYFVDLATGFVVNVFSFAEFPEDLDVTPDGARLYVALPIRDHDHYRWQDLRGFVASFDLARRVQDRKFEVTIDPAYLAATSNGLVLVSSGSGQWTELASYDGATGDFIDRVSIYERTRLILHPSERILYCASPWMYFERYDLAANGDLSPFGLSSDRYFHPNGEEVWITPDGASLVSAGGNLFSAGGSVPGQDLTFVSNLSDTWIDSVAFDPPHDAFYTASSGVLRWYDLTTHALLGQTNVGGPIRHLHVRGNTLYTVRIEADAAIVSRRPIAVPEPTAFATTCVGLAMLAALTRRRCSAIARNASSPGIG